ncbi:MAG: exodeoxyribonuclease VII large subunit [Anaerolineales bacterium]|nr:exodeoxyribonuclease VII large subunit [Anaerolineales bacterium]
MLRDMEQSTLFNLENMVWSVQELNQYLRQKLETDYRLQDLWVTGEISNLSRPASGHLYFSLKDEEATIRCVMWRFLASRQLQLPENGDSVEVHGYISLYESGGTLQIYADNIRPVGEGALFQAFIQLKTLLESEGLFDAERKRTLPEWPHRIGIVTSPSAAALQDVLNVLRRRYPMAEVILSPTTVQGEQAPDEIVLALERVNQVSNPDVILIVRGGGSVEDLWCFNDERVIRAVAASEAPTVSGIGHENDLILIDFAADKRAPTPSAAAEVATPDRADLIVDLRETRLRLESAYSTFLRTKHLSITQVQSALQFNSPRNQVTGAVQKVDSLLQRGLASLQYRLQLEKSKVEGKEQTLRAVGPPSVLERGYAIVAAESDGTIIRSVGQVSDGDRLQVQVADGQFPSTVSQKD